MSKKTNIFNQFTPTEQTYFIEALQGEVVLRELSLGQLAEITQSTLKGIGADGKPEMDMDQALRLRYVKISKALVEPEMTSDDLEALSGKAKDAIKELMRIVDPMTAQAEEAAEAEALGEEIPNVDEK